ncbi:hypothetical protein [Acidipila sp. EB88]|uniref:hypothetical protein n=1 Tax=Acidipila sp. EB88 TaxID=2305226 RepID=UPI000F5E09EB|nr:hypothetical protein [Acidipila sp. EB88]RRA47899.1 hypothetical protein D1Y84_05925 [Acidipila sp. EB88]
MSKASPASGKLKTNNTIAPSHEVAMQPTLLLWLLLPATLTLAQSQAQSGPQPPTRAPDLSITTHVPGVDVLPIPNHPFIANTATVWTRILPDGTTVTLRLNARIARDSQGRVYRERRSLVPAADTSTDAPLKATDVYDPVAHTQTLCYLATHQCVVYPYLHAPTEPHTPPAGWDAAHTRLLVRESIGTNTLDGLDVLGTRETLTLNPGVVGNERPLTTTKEFWYAPELATNLAVTRNDPREGTQQILLSNVTRAEPQPTWFQPPSGFTLQAQRPATSP